MALRTWTSTSDGNWNTATNWQGNNIPAGGDSFRIPAGTAAITTAPTGANIVTLLNGIIEEGHLANIASLADPIKCGITGKLEMRGSGTAYFEASDDGTAGDIEEVICMANTPSGDSLVLSDEGVATVNRILCRRGVTRLTASFSGLADGEGILEVGHMGNPTTDARVEVEAGCIWPEEVIMAGGQLVSNASDTLDRLVLGVGATFTQDGSGALKAGDIAGGTLIWNGAGNFTDAAGDKVNILSGLVDFTQARLERTINGQVRRFFDGRFRYNENLTLFGASGEIVYMGDELNR